MRPRMIIRGNDVGVGYATTYILPSIRPRMIIRGNLVG